MKSVASLYKFGVIEKIIKEPEGEEQEVLEKIVQSIKKEIKTTITQMKDKTGEEIVDADIAEQMKK